MIEKSKKEKEALLKEARQHLTRYTALYQQQSRTLQHPVREPEPRKCNPFVRRIKTDRFAIPIRRHLLHRTGMRMILWLVATGRKVLSDSGNETEATKELTSKIRWAHRLWLRLQASLY